MKCGVVLIVRDWEALNEAYALDHAFEALAGAGLSEPYYVLIAEGFERIPPAFVAKWKERRIHVEDCSDTVRSLVADYPYLEALPDNPTYRVTLLRHLILERRFGGEAVMSVDVDVIWRTDPYRLFSGWTGGYFALAGSGFLTYASKPEWFEAYRLGLESALTGGALTADFEQKKFGIKAVQHDQHLLTHLEAKGLIRNDWDACRSSPALADLCLMHNPLYPKQAFLAPPERLNFSKADGQERFNGAPVAFWHMQTSFCLLCSFHFLCEPLIAEFGGRLPFPRPKAGRDNLKTMLCHSLRRMVLEDRIEDERLKGLKALMHRRGVYKAFFTGKFPAVLFSDRVWWQEGVFE